MRRKFKIGLGVTLTIIIILFIGFSIFIGKATFDGMTENVSREETNKNLASYNEAYNEFAQGKDIKEIKIKSSEDGHEIPAVFIENPQAKGIFLMVHGMGGTKYSLSTQGQIFYDLGFSLLIYDQRNSGDNLAPYNTYGVLESLDCLDAIDYIKKEYPDEKIILYGESYGGATSLIAASRDSSNIDYLILDCPLGDSREMVDEVLAKVEEEEKIPQSFMRFLGNSFLKMKLGFGLEDIDSTKWARQADISIPVLVINSKIDIMTPYHMGREVYESINSSKKEIYTGEDFGHCEFSKTDPEGFKNLIGTFLAKY
ncbi:alpha/beta hydrolase [Anaerococcus sp.]|uniref:alpha/beta hydrolase n=1 Tax=Anaerococcus sp. TaxID=1872515 RepID=UPI0027BAAE6C|nr:alpha/beta fold hydrolase [Anaerococcus sp.]